MKRLFLILALMATFASCRKGNVKLGAETDSLAYVIGMNIGKNLLQMDSTLNVDVVCTAIRESFAGNEKMSFEEAKIYYLRQMNYTKYERFKLYEERFLADLAKSDRAYARTRSGLTYKIAELGNQQTLPTHQRDTVVIRYKITRQDGTEVYSSYERADTTRTAMSKLIVGLQENLKMIGKGGRLTTWVPSLLAYGTGGNEELGIEPNTTLCYEIEVLDVIPYRRKR
ncbi:MAG: FKBP-type peptidyl-prolyl cis-trans isomerase [Alistipes sp.]|nr:FKBP-type peptidyl-prolyl cis-trans isomerase [Alistipes sp.]